MERAGDRLIPARLRPRKEQILYLAVGGWNTLFGYGCFALLYGLLRGQLGDLMILTAAWALSIANAYAGYRYVVFRSYDPIAREFPRFSLVYLVTMAVNLLFFPVALRTLPLNAYVVQGLFTAGVVVVSYLGHRYFSFRDRQERGHLTAN